MLGFEATCRWLAARMNQFGMAGIVSVMLLVCADIFWRIVYVPIMGVYDLVELITGFAIAFTVPYTIFTKGNVVVSLIVNRFPEKHQSVVEIGTLCLSMVLLGVITRKQLWDVAEPIEAVTSRLLCTFPSTTCMLHLRLRLQWVA